MKAAIENFAKFPSTNKVLMLGGMMELGEESIAEHAGIVTLIKQHSWLNVVLVGGDFGKIEHSFVYFNNALEAKIWFIKQAFSNAYLLIKGSRSMAMETILQ
jgi:UDP-N-acetylmuramoyl-tripeptide--D-alanyl-D-alanine ligase